MPDRWLKTVSFIINFKTHFGYCLKPKSLCPGSLPLQNNNSRTAQCFVIAFDLYRTADLLRLMPLPFTYLPVPCYGRPHSTYSSFSWKFHHHLPNSWWISHKRYLFTFYTVFFNCKSNYNLHLTETKQYHFLRFMEMAGFPDGIS